MITKQELMLRICNLEMQAGRWHCACCDTYLEPIDSTHVVCPKCGLKHRFKNGVIQTKGNMMEDYE